MAKPFVDEDGLAFQTTILQLARALDVTVVAEGIENQTQLVRLRDLGCDMGQGFHLSPPLSGVALLDQPLAQVGFWSEGPVMEALGT
jgi:EAL domain-containing protein (putative c-di-GMP-specific phosphodiesterase class I)